eukprot:TRINITY_DN70169_c0_g1_i1.p1 TRINITY_DN70169_c0_g1~~TRINITY_DN70169_c0_g1_i1.p1  ORF type:complete len:351 (+),score=118.74 TRINITY_DN70169_c0_g1_i1:72-1055(+)
MRVGPGTVVALTGAASGIGRALAVLLSSRGAAVALADLNERGLQETLALCKGGKATVHPLDVSSRSAVYAWRDAVLAVHGKCDAVINAAGIALFCPTIAEVTPADFERVVAVNFWGVVHGTQAFLEHFMGRPQDQQCQVVNISSIFGLVGMPRNGPYCATKFAVRGLTESLRAELRSQERHNITAISVHPGGIKTNIAQSALGNTPGRVVRITAREARFLGLKPEPQEVPVTTISSNFDKFLKHTPESAAAAIVQGMERNRSRVLIGSEATAIDVFARTMPVSYTAAIEWVERLSLPGELPRLAARGALMVGAIAVAAGVARRAARL